MEEMKRKNTGLLVVIVIILLAIIIGLLFMIFNKDNNGENLNNKEDIIENKQEEKADPELVNKLMKTYTYYYGGSSSSEFFSINSKSYINYEDLSDSYKYGILLNSLKNDKIEVDDYTFKYAEPVFEKKYYELFGYGKNIKPKNISKENSLNDKMFANGNAIYYENGFYYTQAAYGIGSGPRTLNVFKVENNVVNDEKLEITFKHAFISANIILNESEYGMISVYSNSPGPYEFDLAIVDKIDCKTDTSNQICTFTNDIDNYNEELLTELVMSKYSDKLESYKFTFKYDKEHDNYYFYSLEKLK